ncbi:MAG: hypothetical protein IJX14_00860, partial [Clostridia bacterium]|nr:hypothetical protein [Clostridia bacterium]
VLGVDVFTSYFGRNLLDAPAYARYNHAVGRIDRIMGGGRHMANTAVYYPIETIQADTVPHGDEQIYTWMHRNPLATACWESVRDCMNALLDHQIDFDFLDAEALEKARYGEGAVTVSGGESFRVLVVPYCLESPRLTALLDRLRTHGVTVLRMGDGMTPDALPEKISAVLTPAIRLTDAPQILTLCRENENGRSILAVNTTPEPVSAAAWVAAGADASGMLTVLDPLTEEVLQADAAGFTLDLPPYGAKVLVIG